MNNRSVRCYAAAAAAAALNVLVLKADIVYAFVCLGVCVGCFVDSVLNDRCAECFAHYLFARCVCKVILLFLYCVCVGLLK